MRTVTVTPETEYFGQMIDSLYTISVNPYLTLVASLPRKKPKQDAFTWRQTS
jgi:hypothetical protein